MGGHTGRSTARLHVCTVSNTGHPSVELGNVHALETPLSPSQWGPWAPRRGREKGLGSSRHPSGRLLSFLGLVLLPPPSLFYIEG